MEAELEQIYEKIAKLINLKEGAEAIGSQEEAATASAMIQKLILRYNLDISKVKKKEDKPDITIKTIKIKYSKNESLWIQQLYTVVATNMLGKAIINNQSYAKDMGHLSISIIASELNTELIIYTTDQLYNKILLMRSTAYKQRVKEMGKFNRNAYYRAYCVAVVAMISIKMREQKEQFKKEGGTSLMVINDELINSKVQEEYSGGIKSGRVARVSDVRGASDGYRDGKNLEINPGLGQNKDVKIRA